MKSLYESILTSTKAGKNFEAEKVIEWFKSTNYYKRNLEVYDLRITADYKNGKWAIDIVGDPKDSTFIKNVWIYNLEKSDTQNASGVLPYKLHSISKNGEPMNINYHALKFKDSSEFVEEVHDFISLHGCEVDKIDSLPKNCKEIQFVYKHMLGGGRPPLPRTKGRVLPVQSGCRRQGGRGRCVERFRGCRNRCRAAGDGIQNRG